MGISTRWRNDLIPYKARIRGVNTDGNAQFGFIADATVTITEVETGKQVVRTISGTSRQGRPDAVHRMWEDWKHLCKTEFGTFIYCVNEGNNMSR